MRKLSLLAGLMVLSTSAFSVVNNPDFINAQKLEVKLSNSSSIAKGIRLGLSQSNLELVVESNELDLDTDAQFSIGYSEVKQGDVGFMAEFSYLQVDTDAEDGDVNNTRLSASATYGLNENIYTFGGLNISKYNVDQSDNSDNSVDYDAGLGYQIGMGAQVNKNLALEVAYISLRSTSSSRYEYETYDSSTDSYDYESTSYEVDLLTRGLQINLIGTF